MCIVYYETVKEVGQLVYIIVDMELCTCSCSVRAVGTGSAGAAAAGPKFGAIVL